MGQRPGLSLCLPVADRVGRLICWGHKLLKRLQPIKIQGLVPWDCFKGPPTRWLRENRIFRPAWADKDMSFLMFNGSKMIEAEWSWRTQEETWGRGWMTKASGVGERRKGRGELRRDCHHRVAALFVPTRMQQWYIDIWYITMRYIYIWGRGQGGALSREKSRDVLGEPRNTC